MTVDRSGDYSGSRWRGKVVNVMDPKKSGRIQVRVFNLHDNAALIPDSDLPWAVVSMPINSGASVRGVSGTPVGVIPGTIVDGYFGDSDRRILIATGTLVSAGRTKPGATENGSYALDPAYNDVTNSGRGQDVNAALGLRNLPALSQIGAVFPAVSAGVGSLPSHTGNILTLMSKVDPYNMSGCMAQSVTGFTSSYALNQLTSAASSFAGGLSGLLGALTTAQALMNQGIAEAQALAALPSNIRGLVGTMPGGIGQLASLASTLSGVNPLSLLSGSAVGSIINQAVGIAGSIGGGFSSALGGLIGSLAKTNKLREFALKAAEPTPPPLPEKPTTTSAKAATKPPAKSVGTDPYAQIETYNPPPVVTSEEVLGKTITDPAEVKPVTSEEVLGSTVTTPQLDTASENENIMKQIGQNEQTQQLAAENARSVREGQLSIAQKAAATRAIKSGGGVL